MVPLWILVIYLLCGVMKITDFLHDCLRTRHIVAILDDCVIARGACPDCIMIPETSCLAQNQLLSRAVLKGGHPPREDATHKGQRIKGFLEIVNDIDEK